MDWRGQARIGLDWFGGERIGNYARPVRAIKAGIWHCLPAERSKKGQVRQGGDWLGKAHRGLERTGSAGRGMERRGLER